MIEYLTIGLFVLLELREPTREEYDCYYYRSYGDRNWYPLLGAGLNTEKAKKTVLSMLPVEVHPFVKWNGFNCEGIE